MNSREKMLAIVSLVKDGKPRTIGEIAVHTGMNAKSAGQWVFAMRNTSPPMLEIAGRGKPSRTGMAPYLWRWCD